jgi:tetratricopeptide (TPR) repeat protein
LARSHALWLLTPVLALASPASSFSAPDVRFVDVAAESGIALRNLSGGSSEAKWTILETTGSGACFLDLEGDGDVDLYLVNGGTLATFGGHNTARDALYRNEGGGRFTDVTAAAGIAEQAWGGGCTAGDYDGDGDPDLFVSNFGADALYRNEGDGTFRDVTGVAGIREQAWGFGAAFFDADRDGDLDLFVANYLRFDPADAEMTARRCRWKGGAVMCGPRGFEGQADVFWRNRGDGTFEDASAAAGVGADGLYGMGVVAGDVDGDGDVDLFVANDSQENQLLVNDGGGRFEDQALAAGVALSGDGRAQAGMGADLGDVDGDGDEDLLVTNFSDDYHTLYRNDGDLLFTDVTAAAGLDGPSRSSVGWGGGFFDYDNDGDLDLFIASGHVYPGVEAFDKATSYLQRNLLFENDGRGVFREVGQESGEVFATPRAGRGAAFGDFDDDGDLDVVVVNADDLPLLLRNEGGNTRHWLKVALAGRGANREGVGARVRLTAGGRTQVRETRRGSGYASTNDPRLHFGLGDHQRVARLEVRWPSGQTQVFEDLPADRLAVVDEASGKVALRPLRGAGAGATPAAAAASSPQPAAAPPTAPPSAAAVVTTPAAAQARRLERADLERIGRLVQDGTRALQAGQLEEGLAAYREALDLLPPWEQAKESPDALGFGKPESYRTFLAALHDNYGVGLMRSERLDACAVASSRALEIQPERAKFHHNLGLCHYHARRYPEALAALRAAAASSEPPANIRYDLGRTLAMAGRCTEAEVELAAGLAEMAKPDLRGRDAEAWYHLGTCRADAGQYGEAAVALREVLALVPGHQKALYKLATALDRSGQAAAALYARRLFVARQATDEALQYLRRAGTRSQQERRQLARAFLDAGLAPQSALEAQTALAADSGDVATMAVLGDALLALRPPALEPAGNLFRRILLLDPASTAARRGIDLVAARQALAGGDPSTAAVTLRRLADEHVGDLAVRTALAEALVALPDAPSHAATVLALLDHPGQRYGLGEVARIRALFLLGRAAEASRLLAETPFLRPAARDTLARQLGLVP